jgi:deoxycytidine triphosphate deaminase
VGKLKKIINEKKPLQIHLIKYIIYKYIQIFFFFFFSFLKIIEGRSRFARLGLSVHITASFINPGANNQTVLEIFNASSLTLALYPGTKVCQMIFMTMEGQAHYNGIFQDQAL